MPRLSSGTDRGPLCLSRQKKRKENITPQYCKAHERPVSSHEERAVADAGWIVFASFHGGNGVTVVGGALSEDGMCRPDPYQHFVFVRGKFAGLCRRG